MWLVLELDEEELDEEAIDEEELDEEAIDEEESNNEDSSNDQFYEEFSVSAAPEKWVHMRNSRLYCFWPKTNPGMKIRSCELPKILEDWTIHRCRILMHAEKFTSYKAAKEAERMAQNCSTKSQYNARYGRKRLNKNYATNSNKMIKMVADAKSESVVCNSTMDFDVESIPDDTSYSNEILEGNDSYEYNEIVKYGGDYLKTNETRVNERVAMYTSSSDVDEQFEKSRNKDDTFGADIDSNNIINDEVFPTTRNSPSNEMKFDSEDISADGERSGYNQFKSTSDRIFTSTLLEEHGSPRSYVDIEKSDTFLITDKEVVKNALQSNTSPGTPQNILSKIGKMELMILEFNSNMQQELHQLKECAKLQLTNEEPVSVLKVHDLEAIRSKSEKNVAVASKNIEILKVEVLNAPVHPDEVEIEVPNPVTVENLNAAVHPDEVEIEVPDPVSENTTSVIELPILNENHYDKIEDLVEEDDEKSQGGEALQVKSFADALVEWLLPFDEEEETKYMDRTVDVLFDEKFFIDYISWKNETVRVVRVLKDSNILQCWKKSYETRFQPDDKDNTKFKAHCRRIKGKKRAAMKAAKIRIQTKKSSN